MKTVTNSHPSSTSSTLRAAITVAASVLLFSACSEQNAGPTESASTQKAVHDQHKAHQEVASHEHGAGSYQKPGANIRLGSPEALSMAANSSEQFAVGFTTAKSGTLVISAKPKEGLSLRNAGTPYTFDLSSETPTLNLDISSGEDGTYHVMFHATISDTSGESSRVFGIPVYVGKPNANKAEKPANTSGVVIMKAEETVR